MFLGEKILYYETIDSTQKEVWRKVNQNNIENGTVIITKKQTSGIGTHGRKWHTDNENNIAFSFFIKSNCKIENIDGITIEIAKTLVEVFNNLYNIELDIKYPNDIVYKNKKIGGAIALNLAIQTIGELQNIATSIKLEFGIRIENNLVIEKFCELFEKKLIDRKIC